MGLITAILIRTNLPISLAIDCRSISMRLPRVLLIFSRHCSAQYSNGKLERRIHKGFSYVRYFCRVEVAVPWHHVQGMVIQRPGIGINNFQFRFLIREYDYEELVRHKFDDNLCVPFVYNLVLHGFPIRLDSRKSTDKCQVFEDINLLFNFVGNININILDRLFAGEGITNIYLLLRVGSRSGLPLRANPVIARLPLLHFFTQFHP
ncbi:hypothetical protein SUGI_0078070 [Cryptomeria japonica]|nr:hypothetical protein SUGI_0078070 [Cryptomeria japonica]